MGKSHTNITRFVSRLYEGPLPFGAYKFGSTPTSQVHEAVVLWAQTIEEGHSFNWRTTIRFVEQMVRDADTSIEELGFADHKSFEAAVSTGLQLLRDSGHMRNSGFERGRWQLTKTPTYWTDND